MKRSLCAGLALALGAGPAGAYPLDGFPDTGIPRLMAYRLAAQGEVRPSFLTAGELLPSDAIRLGLRKRDDFELPESDPELVAQILEVLGPDAPRYGIAVLDWTDPKRPAYAAHDADRPQNPGSVGKVAVLLAWFQALADLHPDVDDRRRLLFETEVEADGFIQTDAHDVPLWKIGDAVVEKRPIREGDRANLWTFLDWMASASSNAAASVLMKELVLLHRFGRDYPVAPERAEAFLRDAPKPELSRILRDAMISPLRRSGLDPDALAQGAFFTREGKRRIPGGRSVSTAAELMRFLVRMEQGRLVDTFSSLEIKKLLYLTDHRIRYASHPALADSAVYFKSGSLYGCRPEPGFDCGKFRGNRLNYMNSLVVVESIDRKPALRYAVVVLSNVLKKDSAEVHRELAGRIHRIFEERHPPRRSIFGFSPSASAPPPAER